MLYKYELITKLKPIKNILYSFIVTACSVLLDNSCDGQNNGQSLKMIGFFFPVTVDSFETQSIFIRKNKQSLMHSSEVKKMHQLNQARAGPDSNHNHFFDPL